MTERTLPDRHGDPALRELALEQLRRRRNLRIHLVAQVMASLALVVLWAITEYHNAGGWPTALRTGRMHHDWDPWIVYPLAAGAIAVAAHALAVVRHRPATEAEIAREIDRLRGGQER